MGRVEYVMQIFTMDQTYARVIDVQEVSGHAIKNVVEEDIGDILSKGHVRQPSRERVPQ